MNERPLKFRIYSYTDKSWHYFDIYEGYPQGIYGAVTPPQQFTGLTDKNGKEIYEGDIIKIQDGRFHFHVETVWKFLGWDAITPGGHCAFIWSDLYEEFSVVGNIIENKELLQK